MVQTLSIEQWTWSGLLARSLSFPTTTTMSPAGPPLPSTQELEARNGPIARFTIDCLLFGLLFAQLCLYIRGHRWHRDGGIMQCLVYSLCLIETFRLVVVIQSVWELLIELSVEPGKVSASTPLAFVLPALAGFESAAVQIFFAWRIWSMRRTHWPYWTAVTLITLIAIMQTAGSIGLSLEGADYNFSIHPKSDEYPDAAIPTLIVVWLGGSFVCDLFIVITMAITLITVRRETTFLETERLINYLLWLTAETGALTVLAASVMLGLYLRFPQDNYYLGIPFLKPLYFGKPLHQYSLVYAQQQKEVTPGPSHRN
ncbi:hypothetical protein NP233_g9762 [Leucocoprinus birnbaumii]|uniref:DUF6534 domain-containing protein n=1 Tax=Leucocoprinus birnbaumii TaxID=56174 RepID=A0AAD5YQJ4_9AGAR|nr:hypothetical protein NP233_g9762 [Leucocoprinus birnbaumii]